MAETGVVATVRALPLSVLAAKRSLDVIASAVGLTILSPLLVGVAFAVRLSDGGPAFFMQTRVGRGGKPFKMVKFRTMVVSAPSLGPTLTVAGDHRITAVGQFLRRTKFDELPQLFNVLLGHMSLVGPRPESPDWSEKYPAQQRDVILSVRPGVTDYASVILRDESGLLARAPDPAAFYQERLMPLKFAFAERYVANIGLVTDVRIVLATVWAVFASRTPGFLLDKPTLDRILGASGIRSQFDAA